MEFAKEGEMGSPRAEEREVNSRTVVEGDGLWEGLD